MSYSNGVFVSTQDLLFKGVLLDIKKSSKALQPIFEAFTNAIEAIKAKAEGTTDFLGTIDICVYSSETTAGFEFHSLSIQDDGIGFDDKEFKRFNTFKDFTKGYNNRGSGRIQYAHYFEKTYIDSVFCNEGKFYERKFNISKKDAYLRENAIVYHEYCKEIQLSTTGTKILFTTILENSQIYDGLTADSLKKELLERYMHYFCHNKGRLPKISIDHFIQGEKKSHSEIGDIDIPSIDKTISFTLNYSKLTADARGIEKTEKTSDFSIDTFKISSNTLRQNKLNLVSKGEIAEGDYVALEGLAGSDTIAGNRYIFLVSGKYIDERDSNIRGELNIPTKDSFTKKTSLFSNEEILLDDIQSGVTTSILEAYPEIQKVQEKHNEQLEKLKEMFLLDDETAKGINISVNDSESKILEKFYEAEAKKVASLDANIKATIDKLDKLNPSSDNYTDDLKAEIEELVKVIPIQNKTSLTHYVARRKLVLDLFTKLLNNELVVQHDGRSQNEALIHDLLFKQKSAKPQESDLWIINEDFIYFSGSSNMQLNAIELDGEKIFKDEFSSEEEKYLSSLGEDRKLKRPDVLLFPQEGKCIIIEFKAPNVNVSDHLTQIDKYAGLIRNYTADGIEITTFYGYLLGEAIEPRDVLGAVSSFEESYNFDYLYRPSTRVIGFDGKKHGSIYTEVIKYSTLLKRAQIRNQVFIDKLTK